MALGFVDAIGLLGTGLGIIQFGLDNFVPDQKDAQGTIVGIKGGDGAGASNTLVGNLFITSARQTVVSDRSNQGGKISKVYAYNSQNVQLGTAGSQTMAGNADYLTYTVDQDVPGAQGQYVGIQNGNDATCIAWITVKMFDNSLGGAWTGDIGRSYVLLSSTHFNAVAQRLTMLLQMWPILVRESRSCRSARRWECLSPFLHLARWQSRQ